MVINLDRSMLGGSVTLELQSMVSLLTCVGSGDVRIRGVGDAERDGDWVGEILR